MKRGTFFTDTLYGIPEKIINLIKLLYEDIVSAVIYERENWVVCVQSCKWAETGVSSDIVLDCNWLVNERNTCQKRDWYGQRTVIFKVLDFADSFRPTSTSTTIYRKKTTTAEETGQKLGLKINPLKTSRLRNNTNDMRKIQVTGLEKVDRLTFIGSVMDIFGESDRDSFKSSQSLKAIINCFSFIDHHRITL